MRLKVKVLYETLLKNINIKFRQMNTQTFSDTGDTRDLVGSLPYLPSPLPSHQNPTRVPITLDHFTFVILDSCCQGPKTEVSPSYSWWHRVYRPDTRQRVEPPPSWSWSQVQRVPLFWSPSLHNLCTETTNVQTYVLLSPLSRSVVGPYPRESRITKVTCKFTTRRKDNINVHKNTPLCPGL